MVEHTRFCGPLAGLSRAASRSRNFDNESDSDVSPPHIIESYRVDGGQRKTEKHVRG